MICFCFCPGKQFAASRRSLIADQGQKEAEGTRTGNAAVAFWIFGAVLAHGGLTSQWKIIMFDTKIIKHQPFVAELC